MYADEKEKQESRKTK